MNEIMQVQYKLNDNAFPPSRAYSADAGYDLFTPERLVIEPGQSASVDTGVAILIPRGYVGFLKSKSGLNVKCGVIGEGVIDAEYTGTITARLLNTGKETHIFEVGDKIIQFVLLPIPEYELVEAETDFPETERNTNGFGSTGK